MKTETAKVVEFMQSSVSSLKLPITLATTKNDMPLVFANDAFYEIFEYTPEKVMGHNCRFLQGRERSFGISKIRSAIKNGEAGLFHLKNFTASGTPLENSLALLPLTNLFYLGIQNVAEYQARSTFQHDSVNLVFTEIEELRVEIELIVLSILKGTGVNASSNPSAETKVQAKAFREKLVAFNEFAKGKSASRIS